MDTLSLDSVLKKRNTDINTRTQHLLKSLMFVPRSFKLHTTNPQIQTFIYILLEQLKHYQKTNLDWYKKITTSYNSIPSDFFTIYLAKLASRDIKIIEQELLNIFKIDVNKKTLYTSPLIEHMHKKQEITHKLYQIHELLTLGLFYILSSSIQSNKNLKLYEIDLILLAILLYAKELNSTPSYKTFIAKIFTKTVKIYFSSYNTVTRLSTYINSNKRAKKYLRIYQKRLKFYAVKKRPWRR